MEFNGLMAGFYKISLLISRMAYVNVLWLVFTLAGLVVFGFMPATVAMFSVVRQWIHKNREVEVFRFFWKTYKTEFLKSNALGAVLFVIGTLLYVNFQLVQAPEWWMMILRYVFLVLSVFFAMILLFIFPTYAHFELKPVHYIRTALLIAMSYPHYVFAMGVGIYGLQELMLFAPGFIPFFAASCAGYLIMWLADKAFKKLRYLPGTKVRSTPVSNG
ncbi:YesL family protein [Salibacterium lacus]|uniref:YesL family protein n=1 Tax=Salibacterium lacus TaxID=1898109 RepID=A0ABW5T3W7_9BACI